MALHLQRQYGIAFAATKWHCICSAKMALHLQQQNGIAFAVPKWHSLHLQQQNGIAFAVPNWLCICSDNMHCFCSHNMALHLQYQNGIAFAATQCIFELGRFTSVIDKKNLIQENKVTLLATY